MIIFDCTYVENTIYFRCYTSKIKNLPIKKGNPWNQRSTE